MNAELDKARSAAKNKYKTSQEDAYSREDIDEVIENRASAISAKDALILSNDDKQISGGISSSGANAIDHSIDTLQLEQYDYVEEVRLN